MNSPRRKRAIALFAIGCLALCACESTGRPPSSATRGSTRSGISDARIAQLDAGLAPASCMPNSSQSCYCPDGLQSGIQRCDASGQLTSCVCNEPVDTMPGRTTEFCPELIGSADCTAESYVSDKLPVSMLFVIDRSRSMACNLPPLQQAAECEMSAAPVDIDAPSKWDITTGALRDAFASLPTGNTLAGLTFLSTNGACGVDSTPAVELASLTDTQVGAMDSALSQINPAGQTPIVGATILAYAHLHQEAMAPGNRFVVLLTDGSESCAEESISRLLDVEIPKAREANIRTFVIGAPGSENARALLSEIAFVGGTASSADCAHDAGGDPAVGNCHFDMTTSPDFATALADALGAVELAATSCEYSVPETNFPTLEDNINVQYTPSVGGGPECIVRDDSAPCDGADGWQYARDAAGQPDTTRVVLCGDACNRVRSDTGARIDILVGCSTLY